MATTRDIRRRIKSVANTQQLTRAMKMVSAAKLRRAQESMTKARPYATALVRVLRSLARRVSPEEHPLLARRGDRRVELVVMTGDKGLCGSFNTNIIRRATQFLEDRGDRRMTLHLVGKKGVDFFNRRDYPIHNRYVDAFRQVKFSTAKEIADDVMKRFLDEELDAVYLIYNEFKSMISQNLVAERILPIADLDLRDSDEVLEEYLYEPDPQSLFDRLLPHYAETRAYQAMLESSAAEHAARMTAMESATKNAGEMIQNLTLHLNRVRQASITNEIIEVVSGADAL